MSRSSGATSNGGLPQAACLRLQLSSKRWTHLLTPKGHENIQVLFYFCIYIYISIYRLYSPFKPIDNPHDVVNNWMQCMLDAWADTFNISFVQYFAGFLSCLKILQKGSCSGTLQLSVFLVSSFLAIVQNFYSSKTKQCECRKNCYTK